MMRVPQLSIPSQVVLALVLASAACDTHVGGIASIASSTEALSILDGQGQTGVINTPLATPLTIKAMDATGTPVAGITVTWAVTSGSGSVSPTTVTTTADGIASASYTAGAVTGSVVVTASSPGFTSGTFPITVTASTASVASSVMIVSGDGQSIRKLATAPTSLTTQVRDQFGAGMLAAQVTWVIETGGGALSANTTTTDAAGNASTIYTAGSTVGTSSISATVDGLPPVRFSVIVTGS